MVRELSPEKAVSGPLSSTPSSTGIGIGELIFVRNMIWPRQSPVAALLGVENLDTKSGKSA